MERNDLKLISLPDSSLIKVGLSLIKVGLQ